MSTPFKRYVVKDAVGIAILNSVMNAAYTAYLWWGQAPVALYGEHRVALDLANTPMVIALLSTLLGTAASRAKLLDGRVAVGDAQAPEWMRWLPNGVVLRALVLAALAGVMLAMPLWGALCASGVTALPLWGAVGLKVLITVVMTLLIVPVVIFASLADAKKRAVLPRFAT